jgi:hypothetical protein
MSEAKTVIITDPAHQFYGMVGVIVKETEWYTHVRILYHSTVEILEKSQYTTNKEGSK